ncbi:MAG: cytochrome C biogenesis protein [Sphingomicrobium sp.]
MGFAWLALIAGAAVGLLWLAKLRGPLLTLAAAAIAFGCAGYAWQGRPDLAGVKRAASERGAPMSLVGARVALMGRFDNADSWLIMSDNFASRGNSLDAVGILRSAVREHPRNYKLWVGLANALTDHGRGLNPAARLAFRNAASLAPDHPAPPFFLGLAEARSGNVDEALRLWRIILAKAPANASWRPLVEDAVLAVGGDHAPPTIPKP